MSMGHDEEGNTITLHDLLSEESWLGFRAMRERRQNSTKVGIKRDAFSSSLLVGSGTVRARR